MLIRIRTFLGGALLLVLCLPASLSAQTTFATITGTVTDPTGAVVPGVTVTATNLSTNVPTTVKTNEAGVYTIGEPAKNWGHEPQNWPNWATDCCEAWKPSPRVTMPWKVVPW